MDLLAKADRQALTYGLAGSLALTIGGAFWALPHIEDELDEESLAVGSYTTAENYDVEWNGRDGYLTVPLGTTASDAELVAADLGDIRGTRDVEVRFAGSSTASLEAELARTPAQFELDWSPDGNTASGTVPSEAEAQLGSAFGSAEWDTDADRTLNNAAFEVLTSVVAPLVGDEIRTGRFTVVDHQITVTGVVADAATQERLSALLESEPSVASVNLTVADTAVPTATFSVTWGQASVQQSGTAPVELGGVIQSFGVASPVTAEPLSVDDGVASGLDTLVSQVGTTLSSGRAEVIDGRLSVKGLANSQGDLDDALAALAGIDGDVSIDLETSPDVRGELDAALLQGVEFESNTNIPTSETEIVIGDIASVLKTNPDIAIEITGHTDSRGNDEANQSLSESRAQAVLEGLVARGIDATRLSASGRGEAEPVDSNETLEGQQNNRRVEIEIKENN